MTVSRGKNSISYMHTEILKKNLTCHSCSMIPAVIVSLASFRNPVHRNGRLQRFRKIHSIVKDDHSRQ